MKMRICRHTLMRLAAGAVTVHHLRWRYRQLLREEIANTVTTEDEIADELQSLRRILAG